MVKVFIASDHAGYGTKEEVKKILDGMAVEYEDLGTYSSKEKVDYPDYAMAVGERIQQDGNMGILVCGSGTGMQIAVNKMRGIRAVFAYDEYSAMMAREDNDANVLTLRSREFDHSLYEKIVKAFLMTQFSGEDRHKRRIEKISDLEGRNM